jgi:type IV secretion system protein VirB4
MTQATTNFNSEFLKRIPAAEDWLPKYGRHVSSRVIDMEGKFLVCMRVMGLPFESVNDSVLVSHYDTLTKTISNLGRDHGNKLALWTHFLRRKVRFDQKYQFSSTFAREFTEKYLERFRSNDYFENSFYISLIFKYDDFDDGLKEVEQLGEELYKAMVEYDPEYLETYERNGIMFSHAYSFLGKLWNGYEEEMPVTAAAARELLPSTWMHFGYDAVEIRGDLSSKFAACYDLKDFPGSGWGQLNPLLALPAEFNITQSFTAMTAFESNKAITDQLNKLASVGDKAEHQAKELKLAQGYVSTGEL